MLLNSHRLTFIISVFRARNTEANIPGKRLNRDAMLGSRDCPMVEGDGRRVGGSGGGRSAAVSAHKR